MRTRVSFAAAVSLAVSAAGGTLHAQAPAGSPKDPTLAAVLGVVLPGAGQLYAGKTAKGVGLLVTYVGALGGGIAAHQGLCVNSSRTTCNASPLTFGAGIAAAAWLYGLATAPGDARAFNRTHGLRSSVVPTFDQRDRRSRVGVALAF